MDELSKRLDTLAPAKRALLERRLAAARREVDAAAQVSRAARNEPARASFAQERLWFIQQLEPQSVAYNVPRAIRIRGDLNVKVLERSLDEVISRHDSLRTSFSMVGGSLRQIVAEASPLNLPLVDLSNLSVDERASEVAELAKREATLAFDLSHGPILRGQLLRLEAEEHLLLLTMHHIVSDAWSADIFFEELTASYREFSVNRNSPLRPLPLQYGDFAEWQRDWLQGDVLEEQLSYWRAKLNGAPAVLDMPADRPRPAATVRGATCGFSISRSLTEQLRALSGRAGTTLFMTLLGAFSVLLHRHSGEVDIVVGTPVAGRNRAEIEGLIGFFINTLPLRIDLGGNPNFEELLARVKQTALEAFEHQDVPFEKLVEELKPERSNRIPFFQVMFQFQHGGRNSASVNGLTFTTETVKNETAKVDLSLGAYERDGALKFQMEYSTDLFDEETIQSLLDRFAVLLQSIVSKPQVSIGDLEVMTQAERRRILIDWNSTRQDFRHYESLAQRFEDQVEESPTAVALIDGVKQFTFRELNERANKLAHYLKKLGVEPEVPVALFVERSADMIVALLGVLKAGGAYVPLDVSYPNERVAYVLQDCKARVVLTQEQSRSRVDVGDCHVVALDSDWGQIEAESSSNPRMPLTAANAAYVIYTSGSTGKPKGVVGLHGATRNRLEWMYQRYPFAADEVCCQKTSLSFVDSIWEIFGPLLHGVPLFIVPDDVVKDVSRFIEALNEARVTRLVLVPSLLRAMLETGDALGARLPRLKSWTCSGEALPSGLVKSFQEQLPDAALLNLYGSSEVAADVTYYDVQSSEPDDSIPLGRPIANTEIYILDRNLRPVPTGVIGDIYAGGDGLARGYFERPELTAEKFIPHPFASEPGPRLYNTGDLGRLRRDGAIEYRGRSDHQVKIRGSRVELGEVETALLTHPNILEGIVVNQPDSGGENQLTAYVRSETPALSSRDIRAYLRDKLPEFMVPAAVVVLDDFPRTASGKVDRLRLPQDVRASADYVAPRTLTEEIVAGVIADVLKLDHVGVNDDFFELGGHSLLIPRLTSRLNELFGAELPLRALFDNSRISELAETIANLRGRKATEPDAPLAPLARNGQMPSTVPLTFAQESLWAIDQINPDSGAYNISRALRLQGPLNAVALQSSIDAIVARHEALRTIFKSEDGKPVGVVNSDTKLEVVTQDLSELAAADVRTRVAEECGKPFNLAVGPLLRVTLLRLADDEHILTVTMHHIISDIWSLGIFFDELVSGYNSLLAGSELRRETLSLQYADFAAWQRKLLQGRRLDHSLEYWQQQLAGAPSITDLPTYRERPAVRSFQGARCVFEIPPDLTAALKNLARAERVTLFMMLLGAFQTLLWTYAKHDEVVVGCPSAGRRPGTENIIGYFVNTLALRTTISGNPTFRELMQRVAEATLGALTHEHVPYALVVEKLQPKRRLDHNPLFQVWFVLQPGSTERRDFTNLSVEPYPIDSEVTRHDLQLTVWESSPVLNAAFTYNTDILDAQTVAHLSEQFSLLLATVADRPDIQARELRSILEQTRDAFERSRKDQYVKTESQKLKHARRKPIGLTQLVAEKPVARSVVELRPEVEELSLLSWLTANGGSITEKLQTNGALLFRGFAPLTIGGFEESLTQIAGELVDYSYRSTPRTNVTGRIYTSTAYPAHQTIPLHNEMSYSRQWPMVIGFFCVEPSHEGGETPVADSRRVFAKIDPAIREEFSRKQVMYVRNYDDDLDLSWREVFQTNNRAEVESYCARAGMTVEWRGENGLRTSQVCQAVARHPVTGEMVWFNQAHLFHVSNLGSDVRASLQSEAAGNEPRNAFYGDGSQIDEAALSHIRAVYDSETVTFSWQRGDVLILDNMLAAHGRRPYRGSRQIVVGMGRLAESKESD
jgi:amino acid adenylation domain-containing protein